MIPPIALANYINLLADLIVLWVEVTAPIAVIFCLVVWRWRL